MKNLIAGITICVLTVVCCVLLAKTCSKDDTPKDIYAEQDSIADSLTVTDVLNMREELRLAKFNDSVYLAMPAQVVTAILVTEGINKPIKDIVHTYIVNKDFYDRIVKKSMDIQKKYEPDTIPGKSIPHPSKDSLDAIINKLIKQK